MFLFSSGNRHRSRGSTSKVGDRRWDPLHRTPDKNTWLQPPAETSRPRLNVGSPSLVVSSRTVRICVRSSSRCLRATSSRTSTARAVASSAERSRDRVMFDGWVYSVTKPCLGNGLGDIDPHQYQKMDQKHMTSRSKKMSSQSILL